jgi:CheY-like chemotaxis protein
MGQPLKNKKVLFVEDDKANQYYMQLMLEDIGCSFDLAFNGQEAVEKIKQKKFDIIFMDLRMPVMDGFEATKIIRGSLDKKVLIVAVSAHALTDIMEKCFLAGMNGFIAKGIDVEKFGKELLSWIEKS